MYVREKTITRGEKTYSYYQLVEGERVDGRVRQRFLHHLGRHPSREHADMAARLAGLLCAVLECGKPAAVPHNVQTALMGAALDAGESVHAYH